MSETPKFNPRDIPLRAHYDRLETWAKDVIGNADSEMVVAIQYMLTEKAKEAVASKDEFAKIQAIMAEIGFCRVLDSMADDIEDAFGKDGEQ